MAQKRYSHEDILKLSRGIEVHIHGGAELCSLKQSDLKRSINKNKYNLEDCLSRVPEDDYVGIQTCINDN